MEQAVAAAQSVAAVGRTVDEEVRLDVNKALARRVATHDDAAVLPVVDNVVDVLSLTLDLVVTGGVVDVQVTVEGDVVSLHQTACRVVQQSLADDTVLQGDVVGAHALAVGVDGERLVLSPGKGAVVEDHVLTVGDTGTVLVLGSYPTHTETHMAHDDVAGTRERHAVAIDGDALARSRLTGHIEVVLEHNSAAGELDDTRHVEDDDAVGLAYGIAQRA